MSSRRALLESLLLSRLPAEFQEVEYLESRNDTSGNPYINMGIEWHKLIKIKTKLQSLSSSINTMLFSSSRNKPFIAVSNTSDLNNFVSNIQLSTLVNQEVATLEMSFNATSSNLICSRQWGDNWDRTIRYYYIQLYDTNNVLVRDYVPCYRKADNVAGLYDLVNGVFYTNAGAGTFIVGGNV